MSSAQDAYLDPKPYATTGAIHDEVPAISMKLPDSEIDSDFLGNSTAPGGSLPPLGVDGTHAHHAQYDLGGIQSSGNNYQDRNPFTNPTAEKSGFSDTPSASGHRGTTGDVRSSAPMTSQEAQSTAYGAVDQAADRAYSAVDQTKYAAKSTADQAGTAAANTLDQASYAGNTAADKANYAASRTAENASYAVNKTAENASYGANKTAENARYAANAAADKTTRAANTTADTVASTANNVKASASSGAEKVNNAAVDTTNTVRARASSTADRMRATTDALATDLRQAANKVGAQLNHVSERPELQNAKITAQKQAGSAREALGRSPTILELEKRTGVDRLALVVCGVLAYFVLIPMNLFGLALPTTNFLTLLPPIYLALNILDSKTSQADENSTKLLLAYFVNLGFIQFIESLAAGLLERIIPQYYTVKLIFLAYLLHPRTRGALMIHERVSLPILDAASGGAPTKTAYTPPTSQLSASNMDSPATASQAIPAEGAGPSPVVYLPAGTEVHRIGDKAEQYAVVP